MNGFIVVAIDKNNQKSYIMNTSPILWTSKIKDAKIFEAYKFAKNELEDHFTLLCATLSYTDICSIWILEYTNDKEIGREKFL